MTATEAVQANVVWNLTTTGGGSTPGDAGEERWLGRLDIILAALLTTNTVILMLGVGATTHWRELWVHVRRPWTWLLGVGCQLVLVPALGFGLCVALQLEASEVVAVLLLVASPAGALSTFLTYWVDGDLGLSIMLTATSSVLALGGLPLTLWLFSQHWPLYHLRLPYLNILGSLALVTLPVVAGMAARHRSRKCALYVSKVCGAAGWAGVGSCGALLVLRYWHLLATATPALVMAAALTPALAAFFGYLIAHVCCLGHRTARTLALEAGCQNTVVATSVILLSFTPDQVSGGLVVFPVMYALSQLVEAAVGVALYHSLRLLHQRQSPHRPAASLATVLDTSASISVPVPAHTLPQSRLEGASVSRPGDDPHSHHNRNHSQHRFPSHETQPFLSPTTTATHGQGGWGAVEQAGEEWWPTYEGEEPGERREDWGAVSDTSSPPSSPFLSSWPHPTHSRRSATPPPLQPAHILQSTYNYDSDTPCSPTLSNKGVPNMFPVTERDFYDDEEQTPHGYGCPPPSYPPLCLEDVVQADGELSPAISSPAVLRSPHALHLGNERHTHQFSTFTRTPKKQYHPQQ